MANRKINVTDLIGAVSAASEAQIATLVAALGLSSRTIATELEDGNIFTDLTPDTYVLAEQIGVSGVVRLGTATLQNIYVQGAPLVGDSTSGVMPLNFTSDAEIKSTIDEAITDINITLSLYDTGVWFVTIDGTSRNIAFVHSGFTFKGPGGTNFSYLASANKNYVVTFTRRAATEYWVTISQAIG